MDTKTEEKVKMRMIELFMTRRISASLVFKFISTEFKTITKKEFFDTLTKLTRSKEIIRRKSAYNIKCKCCNNYTPNKEMTGLYCERCSFLGEYKKKFIETRRKNNNGEEFYEYE